MNRIGLIAIGTLMALAAGAAAQVVDYKVVGDGIPQPLTSTPGNAARGKALIAENKAANCLQCHAFPDKALQGGSSGPSLDGVGARLTPPQLRLSVVDFSRIEARAPMPGFHKRASGGGEPRLDAQQVEDIVAYLASLRIR